MSIENKSEQITAFANCLSLVLLILIFSFPMSYIWNKVFVPLFFVSLISYWQTVGLNFFVYFISKVARA